MKQTHQKGCYSSSLFDVFMWGGITNLLPDAKVHPEKSIYYNGALVLKELQIEVGQEILDLFLQMKVKHEMPFWTYVLCLDWLYLIDAAIVDEKGLVNLNT